MVSLVAAILPYGRVGLDTSVFIYHIEAGSPFSGVACTLLQALKTTPVYARSANSR
jgi:hypothetical protein